jgi:hypothetical protein
VSFYHFQREPEGLQTAVAATKQSLNRFFDSRSRGEAAEERVSLTFVPPLLWYQTVTSEPIFGNHLLNFTGLRSQTQAESGGSLLMQLQIIFFGKVLHFFGCAGKDYYAGRRVRDSCESLLAASSVAAWNCDSVSKRVFIFFICFPVNHERMKQAAAAAAVAAAAGMAAAAGGMAAAAGGGWKQAGNRCCRCCWCLLASSIRFSFTSSLLIPEPH